MSNAPFFRAYAWIELSPNLGAYGHDGFVPYHVNKNQCA